MVDFRAMGYSGSINPGPSPPRVPGVSSPPQQPKSGPAVRFGVTDPISLAEPTEHDQQLSARMMEELERELPSETSEGMRRRTEVLDELRVMVTEWMTEVGIDAGMSREEAE